LRCKFLFDWGQKIVISIIQNGGLSVRPTIFYVFIYILVDFLILHLGRVYLLLLWQNGLIIVIIVGMASNQAGSTVRYGPAHHMISEPSFRLIAL